MDEQLELVGIIGLVACLILGIVVVILCFILCFQRCRRRDSDRAPLSNDSTCGDDPPDYAWCAENAGYSPDANLESERSSQCSSIEDIPPTYDSATSGSYMVLDPNRLPDGSSQNNLQSVPSHHSSNHKPPLPQWAAPFTDCVVP